MLPATLFLAVLFPPLLQERPAAPSPVEFRRDVRPILARSCFACHGPDAGTREADLRLDRRDSLLADRGGYHVVVPGDPGASEIILRISDEDDSFRMPPEDAGERLSPGEIETIRRWIEQGASWQEHWSWVAPRRPAVPDIKDRSWPANEIDFFLLAKLEAEGIQPALPEGPAVLARRLSLDLVGLPPDPEFVDAFAADPTEEAYRRRVEELLASPHYGERMAIPWLDLVRYADTDGYHGDRFRSVSLYRDYIINAFNDNLPFDRFTVEQLAGDLLPDREPQARIASGYNRLNRTTKEAGAQEMEFLVRYAVDRVHTTATTWMGATMQCAQCHDHKYDPYTQEDFFCLAAFFADIQEKGVGSPEPVEFPDAEIGWQLEQLDLRTAEIEATLHRPTAELARAQEDWERTVRAAIRSGELHWQSVRPDLAVSEEGAALEIDDDASVLARDTSPSNDIYVLTLRPTTPFTAVRLELLPHPESHGTVGRGGTGETVLTGFEARVRDPDGVERPLSFSRAGCDTYQEGFPVEACLDGRDTTGWRIPGASVRAPHVAVFWLPESCALAPGEQLVIRMLQESSLANRTIGCFRVGVSACELPRLDGTGLPQDVFAYVQIEPEARDPGACARVAAHYRGIAPELDPVRHELDTWRATRRRIALTVPRTLVSESGPPRLTRVLARGDWMDDSGPVVEPDVPHFLPALFSSPESRATRLDLARWLVSPDHPFTARVFVNRLWGLFFGAGLCRSPDDLGIRGPAPTHPELLDWLAVEFRESGWDVKHMVRLMVTSQAYRQSSACASALQALDPGNLLLARQARFRLPAELVRDNALAISGLLSPRVGGPSVRPYQPAGYWADMGFPKRVYQPDAGEDLYRRGLYTFWCRTFLHPSLMAFDAPTREECTAVREPSITPLQALVLLNDPSYVEAARVFAENALLEGGSTFEQRLDWMFRRATARSPTAAESERLEALLEAHRAGYRAEPGSAHALLSVGERPPEESLAASELAAWTSVAQVILNLHETVTRS